MTVTAEKVKQVMNSSIGSMTFYKRNNSKYMDYTEGLMNVQRELGMFWFIDLCYSRMSDVTKDYNKTHEYFYIVKLDVKEDNTAIFTIEREETVGDDTTYVKVAAQVLPYADLPKCEMKFYLILINESPLMFRLLLPSEY